MPETPTPRHSYATYADYLEDLKQGEAIGQSNPDDPESERADQDDINNQLANASSEIDIILGRKYVIPIAGNPPFLRKAAVIIARKELDRVERREHVDKDYDRIIKRLEWLADPRQPSSLVDGNGLIIPPSTVIGNENQTGGGVGYGVGESVFNSSNLTGFVDGYY